MDFKIAFKKFIKDYWGVLSLIYITIVIVVSIFAYKISPDSSINANQMNLNIHSKPPGFSTLIFKVPDNYNTNIPLVSNKEIFMDLSDWRVRIDTVDQILVDLLNRRMRYALEIGQKQRAHGRQVRDPDREKAILDKLKVYNEGPLGDAAIEDIFNRIMQEARDLEEE